MDESRQNITVAALLVAATLFGGASAFADGRHPAATSSRGKGRAIVDRAGSATPAPVRTRSTDQSVPEPMAADRSDRSRQDTSDTVTVTSSRGRKHNDRSHGRGNDDRSHGRGDDGRDDGGATSTRGRSWDSGTPAYDRGGEREHGKRAPYYGHGTISKVHPWKGGYRVWVGGSPYPFYVPSAYYHHGHFNVGMTIRVGGWYNPAGYYDYYGDYHCDAIPGQRLRGFVNWIDPYRGVFTLELANSRDYVTVYMGDQRDHVCVGDFVEVYGDWNHNGRFVAGDVDVVRNAGRW